MSTINILNQSESVEWYTPARYVEAARNVLGGIDLDPASCHQANETIKAARFFTPEPDCGERGCPAITRDGLRHRWYDPISRVDPMRVFLNPPYGRLTAKQVPERMRSLPAVVKMLKTFGKVSAAFIWSHYLLDEYRAGRVRSAILLVNNVASESWFAPLKYFPMCDTDHRIRFECPPAIAGGSDSSSGPVASPGGVGGGASRTPAGKQGMPAPARRRSKKQPTKGQSFIFLPDIDHFRLPADHEICTEHSFLEHSMWELHPSIAAFIGEFARFGFIYLPNTLALQMRDLHRNRKVAAA